MSFRHFEAITCKSDGGFCTGSSTLTGNIWDGALWYFTSWEHYMQMPNLDMYRITTTDGMADIKWYSDDCLLVASDSGVIEVWSLVAPGNDLERTSRLCPYHDELVLCLAVTADGEKGKNVVSGGADGRVSLTEVSSAKNINSLQSHVGMVTSIDTHPSLSKSFVSVGTDYAMKFYDMRNPRIVTNMIAPSDKTSEGNFQSVSWIDSTCVVTGSETGFVSVYDIRRLSQPKWSVHCHSNSVHRVVPSPYTNGLIASASDDGSVCLYDINSQQTRVCDQFHSDFVRGLTWVTHNTILSCGWDGKLHRHILEDISINSSTSSVEVAMEQESEKENCMAAVVQDRQLMKMETSEQRKINGVVDRRHASGNGNM